MVRVISRNLLLSGVRLLLLTLGVFVVLRPASFYYADFTFIEFCRSLVSGRLIDHLALSGLPPLSSAVSYSLTTLLLALLLSYGIGAPFGIFLARYRMAWTQILGHVLMGLAVAVPAFWIAYLVLYHTIMGWGIFLDGRPRPGESGLQVFMGRCLLLAMPLSLSGIAFVTRQVFQTLYNAFPEGPTLAARAAGVSQRVLFDTVGSGVVWRPLLRALPFLISLYISVLVVIETAFFVPGIGYSIYRAANQGDLQSLAILSLWTVVLLLLANLIVDVLLECIDRRHPNSAEPEREHLTHP